MTRDQAARCYAAIPKPCGDSIRRGLPEIGEGILGQFLALYDRPTIEGAEHLAANLNGAAKAVLRYREELIAFGQKGA